MTFPIRFASLAAAGFATIVAPGASAQRVVRPPIARIEWTSPRTRGHADARDARMPSLPGFMRGRGRRGGNQYGNARGMRRADGSTWPCTRNKPSGSEATHSIRRAGWARACR